MTELFKLMEEYAALHRVPVIGIDGAALLASTVADKQPESILEIGTAIGYSTLIIASQMPAGARITTIEIDPIRAAVACDYIIRSGFADRINVLVGDAVKIIPELKDKYDMVFIDAAKGQYLVYLGKILDRLVTGAVIFADNVLFRGWVRGGEDPPRRFRTIVLRLRAYLDFVTTDTRFTTVVHSTGDGVAISCYQGESVLEKTD
jgi:predicted O-methyltransferase YrrM